MSLTYEKERKSGEQTASAGDLHDSMALPAWRRPALPDAMLSRPKIELPKIDTTTIPLLPIGLIVGATAALFAVCVSGNLLIGQLACPLMAVTALHGLSRGGLRKIVMLPVMAMIVYCSTAYPRLLDPVVQTLTGTTGGLAGGIATAVAASLAFFGCSSLVGLVSRRLIDVRPRLRRFNQFAGVLVGLAESLAVVMAVCWVAVEVRGQSVLVRDHPTTEKESTRYAIAAGLVQIADEASTGRLGSMVKHTSPIQRVPELKKMFDDLRRTGEVKVEKLDPRTIEMINNLLRQSQGTRQPGRDATLDGGTGQHPAGRDALYRQLPPPQRQ